MTIIQYELVVVFEFKLMIIKTKAHGRAGLIGNPSDGYFGKTISFILKGFSTTVICYESPRIAIRPLHREQLEFDGLGALLNDIEMNGYYGGIRLIKATIKRFYDYCQGESISLHGRNFAIEYSTDIPVRVGLAGSSAIVTAMFRALMAFYDVQIPRPVLPGLILSVELDELGIGAGLQDRVVQVYEGVVFMDFNEPLMQQQGYGQYESLDPKALPPLFVAYHDTLAEGTEITHNDLRERFNRGDKQVVDAMAQFADLAQKSRDLICAGRGIEIGPLMDRNFDLRAELCTISPGNRQLVEIGRQQGAATKFSGSGGAVVGCYDGDPDRLNEIRRAYMEFGAKVVMPAF